MTSTDALRLPDANTHAKRIVMANLEPLKRQILKTVESSGDLEPFVADTGKLEPMVFEALQQWASESGWLLEQQFYTQSVCGYGGDYYEKTYYGIKLKRRVCE
jgi:hypothetical protein